MDLDEAAAAASELYDWAIDCGRAAGLAWGKAAVTAVGAGAMLDVAGFWVQFPAGTRWA